MIFSITEDFLEALKETNFFQERSGMSRNKPPVYINRWKVGDKINFSACTKIESYSTIASGNVLYSIGSFSSCVSQLPIGSKVGRYTSIATGLKSFGFRHPIEAVTINSASFNFNRENIHSYIEDYKKNTGENIDPLPVPTPQPQKAPITIGNDVWIGKNVTIKGGVSIGDGAIITSDSIVTKNIPSYSIFGGSPAKLIKKRFPDSVSDRLLVSKWWDFELGDLYREELDFSDPTKFLDKLDRVSGNIEKLKPNVFSPSLYNAYGYRKIPNDGKIITHHGGGVLYNHVENILENKPGPNTIELIFIEDQAGNMAIKIPGEYFISIDSQCNISLSKEIRYSSKAVKIKNEMGYLITSSDGESFLCATKQGFTMKPSVSHWEKFIII